MFLPLVVFAGCVWGWSLATTCVDVKMTDNFVCSSGVLLEPQLQAVAVDDRAAFTNGFYVRLSAKLANSTRVLALAIPDSGWIATHIGVSQKVAEDLGLLPQYESRPLAEADGTPIRTYHPNVNVEAAFHLPNGTKLLVLAVAGRVGSAAQLEKRAAVFLSPSMLEQLQLSLHYSKGERQVVSWCPSPFPFTFTGGARVQTCTENPETPPRQDEKPHRDDEL
mmetsp:Transcript_41673/g.90035  ORF Transcript_41673/g.90035 Transcript_41673/m.90035 type:complete len:222 (-) Transcript_41673:203-868(-)